MIVATLAVVAGLILLRSGRARTVARGLIGGAISLAIIVPALFAIGLLLLLGFVGMWLFQAGHQP